MRWMAAQQRDFQWVLGRCGGRSGSRQVPTTALWSAHLSPPRNKTRVLKCFIGKHVVHAASRVCWDIAVPGYFGQGGSRQRLYSNILPGIRPSYTARQSTSLQSPSMSQARHDGDDGGWLESAEINADHVHDTAAGRRSSYPSVSATNILFLCAPHARTRSSTPSSPRHEPCAQL